MRVLPISVLANFRTSQSSLLSVSRCFSSNSKPNFNQEKKFTNEKTGQSTEQKTDNDSNSDKEKNYQQTNQRKELGNPISWANPTSGPTLDDKTSKSWRWVYPVGASLLFLWAYRSGKKHRAKLIEEKNKQKALKNMSTESTGDYVTDIINSNENRKNNSEDWDEE